ncbi:unnamed protein product [Didymodactylos carnosus]|uniref:UBC core domain-containing protein n=1 Tax=Didymodactylos carnosus TaxID=1234261 RepID=A0A814FQU7_9BILA|nr:unnamed protein product [Didymodactylos carnosus]CAF1072753.1 unnamed protein product [Didymodactylos carnosus]CAF3756128.1 unnamed protein product [Didymodactylos carnosus]CAF3836836.1 unnamed protein product [Didymodactylos carnosus]
MLAQASTSSSSNSTFATRLRRECVDLQQNPVPYTFAGPTNDNLKTWLVIFEGSPGSLYENGTFFATLLFDDDYPFTPPTLEFRTRIYHCNIYHFTGQMKHDMFDKGWIPTYTVRDILRKASELLVQCEPDNCAMKELEIQYKTQREEYNKMARLWTDKFAR